MALKHRGRCGMPAIEFFFTNRPGACFYQPLSVSNSRVHCVPVTEQVHPSTICSLASRGPSLVAIPAELPPDTFPTKGLQSQAATAGAFPRIYAPISERHANGFAGCSTHSKAVLLWNVDVQHSIYQARYAADIGMRERRERNRRPAIVETECRRRAFHVPARVCCAH